MEEYVRYRYERSLEAFSEAELLAEHGKWNAVVNRLYYPCFYAITALLLKNGHKSLTHEGTRTLFGKHFVSEGLFSRDQGKLYTKLFDYRQKGDYGDLFDFDAPMVHPLFDPAREFIRKVGELI